MMQVCRCNYEDTNFSSEVWKQIAVPECDKYNLVKSKHGSMLCRTNLRVIVINRNQLNLMQTKNFEILCCFNSTSSSSAINY